jgi:hypothetical protein
MLLNAYAAGWLRIVACCCMPTLFRAVATRLDISYSASGGRSWQHPSYSLDMAAGCDKEFALAVNGLLLMENSALQLMP